jgi:hypothetical protein
VALARCTMNRNADARRLGLANSKGFAAAEAECAGSASVLSRLLTNAPCELVNQVYQVRRLACVPDGSLVKLGRLALCIYLKIPGHP